MKLNSVHVMLKRVGTFMVSLMFVLFMYQLPFTLAATVRYDDSAEILLTEENSAPLVNFYVGVSVDSSPPADTNGADILRAYKMIDITYNSSTNTLSHSFTTHFSDFLRSIPTDGNQTYGAKYSINDIDDYLAIASESNNLKSLLLDYGHYTLSDVGSKINTTPVGTTYYEQTTSVADQGIQHAGYAYFNNVAIGQYAIFGEGSTAGPRVYGVATADLSPHVTNGAYNVYTTYQSDLKAQTPSVDKRFATVSEVGGVHTVVTENDILKSYNIGENITYSIDAPIPVYPSTVPIASLTFKISDFPDEGLDLVNNSIKVFRRTGGGTAESPYVYNLLTLTTDYTLDIPGTVIENLETARFTVTLSQSQLKNSSDHIIVTYDAHLNANAKIGSNQMGLNRNRAKLTFSALPYSPEVSTITSTSRDVSTYGLAINKYATGSTSTRLADAKFKIYTDNNLQNPLTNNAYDIITDAAGFGTYVGIKSGTYYLTEVSAPSGYKLLNPNSITVIVSSDNPITTVSEEETTVTTYVPTEDPSQQATRNNQGAISYAWLDSNNNLGWSTVAYSAENPTVMIDDVEFSFAAKINTTQTTTSTTEHFSDYQGTNGFVWVNAPNTEGSDLPGTGGVGTIIFTVIGGILILGAGVMLITRIRIAHKSKQ